MGKKWKVLEIIILLLFVSTGFSFTNDDFLNALLDTDMENNLLLNVDDSSNWQACYAVINSFLYKDTLDRKYERRYDKASEKVNEEDLSEDIKIIFDLSKQFMKSPVKTIGEIESIQNRDDLLNAYFLHVLFQDWKYTKDPVTAEKLVNIAQNLYESYPDSLFPLYVLLYYNTNSTFGSKSEIETIKKDILDNGIEELYSELLKAEYNLTNYEEVLEVFSYINENENDYNELKTLYGISLYRLEEVDKSEETLKEVDTSEVNDKLVSILYEVLGNIYYNNDDFSKAIEYFNDSLIYNPTNYNSLKNLGLSHYYFEEGDKDLARYYLQVNDYEQSSEEVKNALKELRFDHVFDIFVKRVLPIIAAVIVALFLLEYIHKRRQKKERENLLKNGNKNT